MACLSLWNPSAAATLEKARLERRSVTGQFVAETGSGFHLCSVDFAPRPGLGGDELLLVFETESEVSASRLFETVFQSGQRASVVQTILSELNQDRDFRQCLSATIPHLLRVVGMDAGAVFVVRDARAAELLAIHGPTHQRGYPYQDLDLTDLMIARLGHQPQLVELKPEDAIQPALRAVMKRRFSFGLLSPALAGHAVVGYVVVSSARGQAIGLDETGSLATFCEALGPVIHSHAVSAESERDAAVLQSSQAVFHAISQSLELNQTYQEIATNAAGAVTGSSCLLLELQPDTGDLVTVAASESEAAGLIGVRVRFRTGQELAEALKDKRSILVDDLIVGSGVSSDVKRLLNLRSGLIVPVFAHGELIGSLILYSVGKRMRYSERDMARAEEVAAQAAIAIHNARLYRDLVRSRESVQRLAKRISKVRQDERQTFANVVHDDIVQSIVGARYLLESFRLANPDKSPEVLHDAVGVLQQTVVDARRIIWELRPSVLDELGLEASLAELGRHLDDGPGAPEVHMDIRQVAMLNWETAVVVYKVAREATINANRHAQANHIFITLEEVQTGRDKAVRVRVRDDGVGFDVSDCRSDTHFGCAMMEEQASIIGGRLTLDSSPGTGTTVTLVVPVNGLGS
jgi:signal transduction histidine kinase